MNNIIDLKNLKKEDLKEAGYKAAYLGELVKLGYNVPKGFVITRDFFNEFLKQTDLDVQIDAQIDKINFNDLNSLRKTSEVIYDLIQRTDLPPELEKDIKKHYNKLEEKYLAVRSSATDEYENVASWARELPSYLLVHHNDLIEYIKKCWAAIYHPQCLSFRCNRKLKDCDIVNAVLIQEMINPKLTGSIFSIHPVTCDRNQIAIEALYGLAETDPDEQIHPDTYVIDRKTKKMLDVNVSPQEFMLKKSGGKMKHSELRLKQKFTQKLNPTQQNRLIAIVEKAEQAFKKPIVIEWAMESKEISILQVNPFSFCERKVM